MIIKNTPQEIKILFIFWGVYSNLWPQKAIICSIKKYSLKLIQHNKLLQQILSNKHNCGVKLEVNIWFFLKTMSFIIGH